MTTILGILANPQTWITCFWTTFVLMLLFLIFENRDRKKMSRLMEVNDGQRRVYS